MPAYRSTLAPLVLAMSFLAAPPASACSCLPPPPVEQALQWSVAVFIGTVVEVRSAEPEHMDMVWATLAVSAWWKGDVPDTVRILTGENDGICGYAFESGVEHLVFAFSFTTVPSVWWTHLCSRTHAIFPQDPDIIALGPPHTTSTHVLTWGALKRRYRVEP